METKTKYELEAPVEKENGTTIAEKGKEIELRFLKVKEMRNIQEELGDINKLSEDADQIPFDALVKYVTYAVTDPENLTEEENVEEMSFPDLLGIFKEVKDLSPSKKKAK